MSSAAGLRTAQDCFKFFFIWYFLLAHSFWLNKVSSFLVSWSLITSLRAFCFEALDWPKEGHSERGLVVLEIFPIFITLRENHPVCREGSGFHLSLGVIDCLSFKGLMEEVRVLEREEVREKERRKSEIYDLLDHGFYVA